MFWASENPRELYDTPCHFWTSMSWLFPWWFPWVDVRSVGFSMQKSTNLHLDADFYFGFLEVKIYLTGAAGVVLRFWRSLGGDAAR